MIKAVLFDLDGTLVNSLEDLADCVNHTISKHGYPKRETEKFKYFAGNGIPKMIERALPEEARTPETVGVCTSEFLEYYAVHFVDKTTAYPGMKELLSSLKEQGIAVAVVTNKVQHMAESVVKKIYGNVFDIIIGMSGSMPAKPDPTSALTAMKALGVTPEECIFIGDSGMDAATGVNSGAFSVGALWGFREKEELIENGATWLINSPNELLSVIKEINK